MGRRGAEGRPAAGPGGGTRSTVGGRLDTNSRAAGDGPSRTAAGCRRNREAADANTLEQIGGKTGDPILRALTSDPWTEIRLHTSQTLTRRHVRQLDDTTLHSNHRVHQGDTYNKQRRKASSRGPHRPGSHLASGCFWSNIFTGYRYY